MYTEIMHDAIASSVLYIRDQWLAGRRNDSLCINRHGRRGVCMGKSRNTAIAVTMSVETIVQIVLYELKHAFFHVGKSHVLQQIIGVSMGSKAGPVLAWAVCMVHEHKYHASLGADSRFIHVKRYFDDVWQLVVVPADKEEGWSDMQVRKLLSDCYPSSPRLILNSCGHTAHMLGCITQFSDGQLHCLHRHKNAVDALGLNQLAIPVTSIIPYSSAHVRRASVMRNTVLGLLHRIHMNTLDQDVLMLLPVLLSHSAELVRAGYPRKFVLRCLPAFLRHSKVQSKCKWHMLTRSYSEILNSL
jgi:hypothetical protein